MLIFITPPISEALTISSLQVAICEVGVLNGFGKILPIYNLFGGLGQILKGIKWQIWKLVLSMVKPIVIFYALQGA